jgi:plasmid maintenance system antidote protein VapI
VKLLKAEIQRRGGVRATSRATGLSPASISRITNGKQALTPNFLDRLTRMRDQGPERPS